MLSEERDESQEIPEELPAEETVMAPEEEGPAELLETIPAQEQSPGQLLEACPACGTLMDVTEQAPFAKIFCPSCGQSLRARRQFNNYRLIDQIGEGGMGSVFKATDCNLQRNVALKILKRECSANAEEQAKLEQEARVTASINHPHVVKVFSFGQDHDQFYLAMELVEKGSLDHLMGLLRRVPEAQVLSVGIQIAEGLEAGLERGLIHRDIKPGNILFSDPHTAKLVDFGLAVVMDELAQTRGEIWGTPYYIAPEKLDNQLEDFRSDIYSLGGTLFHALAGRPPYEAETASMVALKQLKSQPISLQAFAPDVSSETAYVINRMLAKDREDRYGSYRELIDHLSYARHKLLERAQKPQQPKARVVIETQESRNLTAYLSLGLLITLIVVGVLVYIFRDKLFGDLLDKSAPAPVVYSAEQAADQQQQGVKLMVARQFEDARKLFDALAQAPGIVQPAKNWALFNEGLANLALGQTTQAAAIFSPLSEGAPYSTELSQVPVASFFVSASKPLATADQPIRSEIQSIYSNQTFEAFGVLCFAMHDWALGKLSEAGPLLAFFMQGQVAAPDQWIEAYKPFASVYLADYNVIAPIEQALPQVADAAAAETLIAQVRKARETVTTGNAINDRLQAIETQLIAKGAKPQ